MVYTSNNCLMSLFARRHTKFSKKLHKLYAWCGEPLQARPRTDDTHIEHWTYYYFQRNTFKNIANFKLQQALLWISPIKSYYKVNNEPFNIAIYDSSVYGIFRFICTYYYHMYLYRISFMYPVFFSCYIVSYRHCYVTVIKNTFSSVRV